MIPVKHIDPDDIALYAMQLLPPDETEEMTLHLQHSAEARRVLSEIYSDLSIFAHSAEMHSPPAMARQRLMKHVAREKKAVPVEALPGAYAPRATVSIFEEEVAPKSFASKAMPWVGWALAAGMAGLSVNLYMQRQQMATKYAANEVQLKQTLADAAAAEDLMETLKDPGAVHATLTGAELHPPPQGRVTYLSDKGTLLLVASNLDKLQPYKVYELWLIPMDGRDPIPAGTFKPDAHGNASVILPQLEKGIVAKKFAVTIEDGEGSPTPTTAPMLAGVAG